MHGIDDIKSLAQEYINQKETKFIEHQSCMQQHEIIRFKFSLTETPKFAKQSADERFCYFKFEYASLGKQKL